MPISIDNYLMDLFGKFDKVNDGIDFLTNACKNVNDKEDMCYFNFNQSF